MATIQFLSIFRIVVKTRKIVVFVCPNFSTTCIISSSSMIRISTYKISIYRFRGFFTSVLRICIFMANTCSLPLCSVSHKFVYLVTTRMSDFRRKIHLGKYSPMRAHFMEAEYVVVGYLVMHDRQNWFDNWILFSRETRA